MREGEPWMRAGYEPGVVPLPRWRPGNEAEAKAPTMAWAGVGRKP